MGGFIPFICPLLDRLIIFFEEIVSETTVHLGFIGRPGLTVRPGPKLLTGLPGPELTVRPAGTEPLIDLPGPPTDRPGGPWLLTGRRMSCGLFTGRLGPPELLKGLPEPPGPLMGRPGPVELLAGRPGPFVPLTVRPEGCGLLAGFRIPLTDCSGPELELPFWRLGIAPELTVGRAVPGLGRPEAESVLLPGCLIPELLALLCEKTVGSGLEWLG